MAARKSTAPSGLSIARDGLKFTLTWKIPAAKYGAGQWVSWRILRGSAKKVWSNWTAISVSKTATKASFTLDASKFYPQTSVKVAKVEFIVKGKTEAKNGTTYTVAAATKIFAISPPKKPTISASLDSDVENKCTFTWEASYEKNDTRHFSKVEVGSSLRANYAGTLSAAGYTTNKSLISASGSWAITEDGSPTQDTSYLRAVRVRAKGIAGDSDYAYAYHYYAIPCRPSLEKVSSKAIGSTGRYVKGVWTQSRPQYRPVDTMVLQYAIDTPAAGEKYSGDSWSDGVTVAYKDSSITADFITDDALAEDKVMWCRVQTTHDKKTAFSDTKVAARGALQAPSFDTVSASEMVLTITGLSKNTDVPDAKTAVWMSFDDVDMIVAITDGEGTVTASCPDVTGATGYQVGLQNFTGSYVGDGAAGYYIDYLQQSKWVWSEVTGIATPPKNLQVSAASSDTVRLSWEWSWEDATAVTISWADHADAWVSTQEPSSYDIDDKVTAWNVGGLEDSGTYYFRVRLRDTSGDEEVLSPWSDIVSLSLSEAPTTPTLAVDDSFLTESDSLTCVVGYTGNSDVSIQILEDFDNTPILIQSQGMQALSETLENINKIYTQLGMTDKIWTAGSTHSIKAGVVASGGSEAVFSDPVSVQVVAMPEITAVSTSLVVEDEGNFLEALPFTITPTFSALGNATVKITRAEDYQIRRPDERKEERYAGEIVAALTGDQDTSYSVALDDLSGQLDDGAKYKIEITFTDVYGHTAEQEILFSVRWSHQPETPAATVATDSENRIAVVAVTQPAGYADGDTFDLYRLSVGRPELILSGGEYGVEYVDPYPALTSGGLLIVNRTANGDYITSENSFAWSEYEFDLEEKKTLIEFDEELIELQYDMSLDNSWSKDFERTSYLGGSVQGDWNPAVTRDLKFSGKSITTSEPELIEKMRRLSDYPGICHIRTPEGSSFSCDIQVSETIDGANPQIVEFDLTISKVDAEEEDGMTYTQWRQENGLE